MVNVIAIAIVIHTADIENFLQRWISPAADFVQNFQKFIFQKLEGD